MFAEQIGKYSEKVKNKIERSVVKKFAEAIGDPNPIYWDEETGKNLDIKTISLRQRFQRSWITVWWTD